MKKIEVRPGEVEGRDRLCIYFRYDRELISLVKGIPGARWEHFGRYWIKRTRICWMLCGIIWRTGGIVQQ